MSKPETNPSVCETWPIDGMLSSTAKHPWRPSCTVCSQGKIIRQSAGVKLTVPQVVVCTHLATSRTDHSSSCIDLHLKSHHLRFNIDQDKSSISTSQSCFRQVLSALFPLFRAHAIWSPGGHCLWPRLYGCGLQSGGFQSLRGRRHSFCLVFMWYNNHNIYIMYVYKYIIYNI